MEQEVQVLSRLLPQRQAEDRNPRVGGRARADSHLSFNPPITEDRAMDGHQGLNSVMLEGNVGSTTTGSLSY